MFVRFIKQREKEGKILGLDELLVLSILRLQREPSLSKAASLLQLNRQRTREVLMQMVSQGLLERSGIHKGLVFRLSGAIYRDLGESVVYIREQGIDNLRFKELILEYVRQYGSITNRQVRELLGVEKYQVRRSKQEKVSPTLLKQAELLGREALEQGIYTSKSHFHRGVSWQREGKQIERQITAGKVGGRMDMMNCFVFILHKILEFCAV